MRCVTGQRGLVMIGHRLNVNSSLGITVHAAHEAARVDTRGSGCHEMFA
eukprot:SAG11_NODE_1624_length_4555_cov_3.452424_8_plen_49_part_00